MARYLAKKHPLALVKLALGDVSLAAGSILQHKWAEQQALPHRAGLASSALKQGLQALSFYISFLYIFSFFNASQSMGFAMGEHATGPGWQGIAMAGGAPKKGPQP